MRTDGVRALGVDVTHGNCWITLVHVWENQIVCGRFKSKRGNSLNYYSFVDSSDQLLPAGAKILLCTTRSGSKISPSLFVKFLNGNGLLFNDYLCGKKENFQFYFTCSQIDQFKRDYSIPSKLCFRQISHFLNFISVYFILSFPSTNNTIFGGGGGRGLQSNHDISINVFVRSKPIFVCRICELINTWIHLRFSCHKEPEQSSRVQSSETSICRWLLVLLRSFWFPCKSPQAAQEWNREGLEGKKAAISIAL